MKNETAWRESVLQFPVVKGSATVTGARIAYRIWDCPGALSTIVHVHGGAAHAHWWDPVAPHLTSSGRVVALDLSGHGDSDWRDAYNLQIWAREVLAVATRATIGPVTLIGHSLGGLVSTYVAGMLGIAGKQNPQVTGTISVDSLIGEYSTGGAVGGGLRQSKNPVYPTLEAGVARFRPVPDRTSIPRIADHIARRSLRRTCDG